MATHMRRTAVLHAHLRFQRPKIARHHALLVWHWARGGSQTGDRELPMYEPSDWQTQTQTLCFRPIFDK